jgi:predicted dithiol-disulfide oxidoreductase (DUF899 family)
LEDPVTDTHDVVPHDAWLDARVALLEREKQFTRLRDELSQARRDLPWEAVDKHCTAPRARSRWPTCSTVAAS